MVFWAATTSIGSRFEELECSGGIFLNPGESSQAILGQARHTSLPDDVSNGFRMHGGLWGGTSAHSICSHFVDATLYEFFDISGDMSNSAGVLR
jgi:hypothetical protein